MREDDNTINNEESLNDSHNNEKNLNSDEEYEKYMNSNIEENTWKDSVNHNENEPENEIEDKNEDLIKNSDNIIITNEFKNNLHNQENSFANYNNSHNNLQSEPIILSDSNTSENHLNHHKYNSNEAFNYINTNNFTTEHNFTTNLTNEENPLTPKRENIITESDLQISKSFSNFILDKDNKKSKINKISKISKINKSSSNISNITNNILIPIPGERLYQQYMNKLPKKKEHIDKIKEDRIILEMAEVRIKPEIDKRSVRMVSTSPDRIKSEKIEDRLIKYGIEKREKIIREKTKKHIQEFDYSHYPNINQKSRIIATMKRKERLNILNNIKNIKLNKTSDDIDHFDIIDSDEEYNTNNILGNYTNQNLKMSNTIEKEIFNSNNICGQTNKNENINTNINTNNNNISYNSSNYTFTNMKLKENSSKRDKKHTPFRKSNNNIPKSIPKNNSSLNIINNKSIISKNQTENKSRISSRSRTPLKLNPEKNIHDFLYLESKMITEKKNQEKKNYMNKKYPFKPTIPDSSKNLIKRNETQDQFTKRLLNSKKESQEIIIKQRQKEMNKVDKKTGKPFFKPTIGRGPINPKTREVTVNLDGFYDNKLLNKEFKVKENHLNNNLEKKKLFLENSMKSILKMKIDSYKEIFDKLDSDKDGLISSRNIKLSSLDSDLLNRLTPILEELQNSNIIMNFKQFCLSADKYLSVKIFSTNCNVSEMRSDISKCSNFS